MKKWIILLIWLLPGVHHAQDLVQPVSIMAVDKLVHDFGVVGQTSTVQHQFRIENQGKADLLIHKVKSSCDCITKLMGDKKVPAGSERMLKVMFDTRQSTGMQQRSVEIHSNDPESPLIKLELFGKVVKDYAVIPSSLHFKNLTKGESASKLLKLRQFSDADLEMRRLDTSASWLSARWSKLVVENGFTIKVEVDKEAPSGSHMEVLSIYFDQGGKQVIDVPVLINVSQDAENEIEPLGSDINNEASSLSMEMS